MLYCLHSENILKRDELPLEVPLLICLPHNLPQRSLDLEAARKINLSLNTEAGGVISMLSHVYKNEWCKIKKTYLFAWWVLYLWINLYEPFTYAQESLMAYGFNFWFDLNCQGVRSDIMKATEWFIICYFWLLVMKISLSRSVSWYGNPCVNTLNRF